MGNFLTDGKLYSPLRPDLALVVGALTTVALVAGATARAGLGLTHDSVYYLFAAHSLFHHGALLLPDGAPMTAWTPLYPLLIAPLHALPVPLPDALRALHLVLAGAGTWLALSLARRALDGGVFFGVAWTALVFGTPVVLGYYMAWSEADALVLLLALAHRLVDYTARPVARHAWVIAGLLALLLLQRQAALFFAPGVVALVWYYAPCPRRRWHLVTLALAAGPLLGWWRRTRHLTGRLLYAFTARTDGPAAYLTEWFDPLTSWYLPPPLPLPVRVALLATAAAGVTASAWSYAPRPLNLPAPVVVSAALLGSYVAGLAGFTALVQIGDRDERLLTLVYPFGILLAIKAWQGLARHLPGRLRPLVVAGAVAWAAYPVVRTLHNVQRWRAQPSHRYVTGPEARALDQLMGKK